MFGWFKKKPTSSIMDEVSRSIYGPNAKKTAVLPMSVSLAHTTLLQSQIPYELIEKIATGLDAGPVPYSTYDLAASVALGILKDSDLPAHMAPIAVNAIEEVQAWSRAGLMAPKLADSFIAVVERRLEAFATQAENARTHAQYHSDSGDLRGYIISKIMDAPEFIMVKFILSAGPPGSFQKNVEALADVCIRRIEILNSTDALLGDLDQLHQIWVEKMEAVVENRGGLGRIEKWPPELANAVVQTVGKMFVFQDLLTRYYQHPPTIEKYGFIVENPD